MTPTPATSPPVSRPTRARLADSILVGTATIAPLLPSPQRHTASLPECASLSQRSGARERSRSRPGLLRVTSGRLPGERRALRPALAPRRAVVPHTAKVTPFAADIVRCVMLCGSRAAAPNRRRLDVQTSGRLLVFALFHADLGAPAARGGLQRLPGAASRLGFRPNRVRTTWHRGVRYRDRHRIRPLDRADRSRMRQVATGRSLTW